MTKHLLLIFPFLSSILFGLQDKPPWFSFLPKEILISISSLCIILSFLIHRFPERSQLFMNELETVLERNKVIVFLIFFIFSLTFPFRNLNWGDGIILLEANEFETKLFGTQTSMDEILETVIHSYTYRCLLFFGFSDDNRLAYQILSSLAGLAFICFAGFKIKIQNNSNVLAALIFLTSSGFLVFFGYSENYSLVSLSIFFTIYFSRDWILQKRDPLFILLATTSFVVLSIYLHLVAGYLVFLLFFLWWEFSPKDKKLKHFFICSVFGGLLLSLGFIYFLFISDPTIDRRSSHVLHPPFYPWRRIISANHIKEILGVIWWNSKLPVTMLIFSFMFHKAELKKIFARTENQLLLVTLFSFFLHAFLHNPQLGFPADWDLMGFYWIPFAYLGYLLFLEIPGLRLTFLPLLFFGLLLQIFHALELSKPIPEQELRLRLTRDLIEKYVTENKQILARYPKTERKFYAKNDFFFFKALAIADSICHFEGKSDLIEKLNDSRIQLINGQKAGLFSNKDWLKEYLTRATNVNTTFVKSLEEHKLCHPAF